MPVLTEINAAVERELDRMAGPKLGPAREGPLLASARKMAETMKAVKSELRWAKIGKEDRAQMNADLLEAAKADLVSLFQEERERIAAELAKEEKRFTRDRELYAAKYAKEEAAAALRFKAMSKDELLAAARDFEANPQPWSAGMIDALSAELKAIPGMESVDDKGFLITEHERFRQVVTREKRYEPHRFTPAGAEIVARLEVIDGAIKAGGEYVPILHEGGGLSVENTRDFIGEV